MNIEAVLAQTMAYLESAEGKALVANAAKNGAPAERIRAAADQLVASVNAQIPGSLSYSISAEANTEFGNDGIAKITLTLNGILYRPSLNPGKYAGAYDIVGLFAKGWSYGGYGPQGMWHGRMTYALTHRNADPFIARAVSEWVASCGLDILSYSVNSRYT